MSKTKIKRQLWRKYRITLSENDFNKSVSKCNEICHKNKEYENLTRRGAKDVSKYTRNHNSESWTEFLCTTTTTTTTSPTVC